MPTLRTWNARWVGGMVALTTLVVLAWMYSPLDGSGQSTGSPPRMYIALVSAAARPAQFTGPTQVG